MKLYFKTNLKSTKIIHIDVAYFFTIFVVHRDILLMILFIIFHGTISCQFWGHTVSFYYLQITVISLEHYTKTAVQKGFNILCDIKFPVEIFPPNLM